MTMPFMRAALSTDSNSLDSNNSWLFYEALYHELHESYEFDPARGCVVSVGKGETEVQGYLILLNSIT